MADEYDITLSDGTSLTTVLPLEADGGSSTGRNILAVDLTGGAGTNFIEINTDLTSRFIAGFTFEIFGSASNDGTYTVVSSSFVGGNTRIVVAEALLGTAPPLGSVRYDLTDSSGPNARNSSVVITGRGQINFGEDIMEDVVRLSENFAVEEDGGSPGNPDTTIAPHLATPLIGQLWYNKTDGKLYRWDGAAWQPGAGDTEICDVDGDTCVKTEESADEDIIRFDTGDSPVGYDAIENIMTLASSGWTVNLGTSLTTDGAPIDLTTGSAPAGYDGGNFNITSGDGDNGGDINIISGYGSVGEGGDISITAGDGISAGDVIISSGTDSDQGGGYSRVLMFGGTVTTGGFVLATGGTGASSGGDGGFVELEGGPGGTAGGDGGLVRLEGGNAQGGGGAGGNVILRPGAADGAGAQGVVEIRHSDSPTAGEVRFFEPGFAVGDEYVGLRAPDSVTTSRTWILPDDDPTVVENQYLTTDSAGVLSFAVGAGRFEQSFVDGDLVSDVLTVTHNLGTQYNHVTVYDNNDEQVIPTTVTATSTTQTDIDFTGATPLTGTWNVVVSQ